MVRNRSRSQVREGVRYLRNSRGQYNGSVGSGRTVNTGDVVGRLDTGQRSRLNQVLSRRRGTQRVVDLPEVDRLRDELKQYQGRELTTPEKFNKKLLETRIKRLESESTPTLSRLPRKLNPQDQTKNKTFPAQTLSQNRRTVVNMGTDRVQLEVSYDKSFSVELDPNFRYKVPHEGKDLVLNDNALTMRFQGEVVKGVPNIFADKTKASDEELVYKLAVADRMVVKGSAPKWDVKEHGQIVENPDELLTRRRRDGARIYKGMQIHHVNQWAADPASQIEADFNAGKIDQETRYKRYLDTVEPDTARAGKWKLKLKPKGEREFVILPGGLHDGTSPLYLANHPLFFDPTKNDWGKIGIPKTGEGSRDWFDTKFRKQFWREYAKYQMEELATEVNDRVKSGRLPMSKVKELYNKSLARVQSGDVKW